MQTGGFGPAAAPTRRTPRWLSLLVAGLVAGLAACAAPPAKTPSASRSGASPAAAPDPALQPERASGFTPRPAQRFEREAVVAAHPLAAEAGAQMLREGGSAVDAALAAQLVLGLVEPQSSGIGGGGFLLHWDGRAVQAYDGRETAPAAVGQELFLDERSGAPLGFATAAIGGRSVGVPGLLRMLELAHREHGKLPWERLFDPAIMLAEQGFPVGARLHALLRDDPVLKLDPDARAYFYAPDGTPWPVGHGLRNPEYAALLRELARSGAARFYEGRLGRFMVATAGSHLANPGRLTLADLAGYRALEREPLCHDWRRWRVCGMPPPSAGAIVVGQMLGILEQLPATAAWTDGRPDAGFVHRFTQAARLAHADRQRFIGDPDHVPAPAGRWSRLLDADYLTSRSALAGPQALGLAPAGSPDGRSDAPTTAPARSPERPSTTHLSVVDAEGRAVALTSSLEAQFGAHVMVNRGLGLAGGFLLNNQLTDFSFAPVDATGRRSVNRVEPGKRPRSNMAPTLVFERTPAGLRLEAVLGSPGGVVIPLYVAKAVWAMFAEGVAPQAAVALPHFAAFDGPTLLESGADASLDRALAARGHSTRRLALTSGLHLLRRDGAGWQAGVDPRREGAAAGR